MTLRRHGMASLVLGVTGLVAVVAWRAVVHGQVDSPPVAVEDGAFAVVQGGTLAVAAPGVLANDAG